MCLKRFTYWANGKRHWVQKWNPGVRPPDGVIFAPADTQYACHSHTLPSSATNAQEEPDPATELGKLRLFDRNEGT